MPRKTIEKISIREDLKRLKDATLVKKTPKPIKTSQENVSVLPIKPKVTTKETTSEKYVIFSTGTNSYAANIMQIIRIEAYNSQEDILDVQNFLGLGTTENNNKNVVLIFEKGKLLANRLADILTFKKEDINPSDENIIEGKIFNNDKVINILNIENLFRPD